MATLAYHPNSFAPFLATQQAEKQPAGRPVILAEFNELVLTYQDAVYRQALWILGDEAAAEDATQEAFLRAYCKIDTYNGGPFRPWILRIVINYCYDQLRRRKVRRTIPLEMSGETDQDADCSSWLKDTSLSIEEMYEISEEQASMMGFVQRLAPPYRSAVLLVDVEGMDYQEAAQTLGIPLGTFKSRLSRARDRLQVSITRSGCLNSILEV